MAKVKEELKKLEPKKQEQKEVVSVEETSIETLPTESKDVSPVLIVKTEKPTAIDVMDESVTLFSKKLIAEAKAMVDSKLLPNAIDTPEKAIIVMQKGRELGFQPMASFEHIVVINNKPTLDGVAMITKLREGGVEWQTIRDYDPLYDIDGVRKYASEIREEGIAITKDYSLVDSHTVIRFFRPSKTSESGVRTEDAKFTYKEAATADLLKKDVWKKYLRVMMWWRCFALGARRIAGDLTMGMHTVEEIDASGKYYLDASGKVQTIK